MGIFKHKRGSDEQNNPRNNSNRSDCGTDIAYIWSCVADGGGVTDLLLNPPIIMTVVNLYGWLITMLQQLIYQSRINVVKLIVGRVRRFIISMPEVITIRTFVKVESSIIVVWTLFGKRITNTDRICL